MVWIVEDRRRSSRIRHKYLPVVTVALAHYAVLHWRGQRVSSRRTARGGEVALAGRRCASGSARRWTWRRAQHAHPYRPEHPSWQGRYDARAAEARVILTRHRPRRSSREVRHNRPCHHRCRTSPPRRGSPGWTSSARRRPRRAPGANFPPCVRTASRYRWRWGTSSHRRRR